MKTNKAQHTPGNWETLPRYTDRQAVPVGKMRQDGSKAWDIFAEAHGPNCEANARLIAAAPELLEALCELESALMEIGRMAIARKSCIRMPNGMMLDNFIGQLLSTQSKTRAAISKAQGKD